jgi:hypothetical protein
MAILWIDSEFPAKPDGSRHAEDDGVVRDLFAAILQARGALPEARGTRFWLLQDRPARYAGHFGPPPNTDPERLTL